jgi:DNA-binding MarR family transcriptional regulator
MTAAEGQADSVDLMIAEWGRAMPGLEFGTLHVVSRMLRLIRLFERDREHALESFELEPWSFDMLALLRRRPDMRSTPRELMGFTLVTSGTMTARLKSLETRGWITRAPDAVDRRQVVVALTVPGRELFDRVFRDVLACQARLIAPLTGEEKEYLAEAFRKMLLDLDHDPVH